MQDATSSAHISPEHGLLGFSGSRDRLSHQEMYVWRDFLSGLGEWSGFVTGGCVGFDDFAGRTLVELFPTHIHRIYVPADRSRVAAWWRDPKYKPLVEVREMMPGTTYDDRNQALVNDVAALVAKPKLPEANAPRSGTWLTVRMARAATKPVIYGPNL